MLSGRGSNAKCGLVLPKTPNRRWQGRYQRLWRNGPEHFACCGRKAETLLLLINGGELTLGRGLPLLLFAETLVEIGVDHFHETVHTAFEEVVRIGDHGVLDDDALLGLKPLD